MHEETKEILKKRAEERTRKKVEVAVKGETKPGIIPDSMTVFAQNPAQMREAQAHMVEWAKSKEAEALVALEDLQTNLDAAKKNKWRTSTLRAAVTRGRNEVRFYEKIRTALEAGYVMVPNFPVGIFAIRTTKKGPKQGQLAKYAQHIRDNDSSRSPVGDGEYVDPSPRVVGVHGPDGEGKIQNFFQPDKEWEPVSFPFTAVKPDIMKATTQAMALKVFDEVGCLPDRRRGNYAGDPIILGQIVNKQGYNEKRFSFLVAWFMDLSRM